MNAAGSALTDRPAVGAWLGRKMEKDEKGAERINAEIERRESLSIRTAKTCRDDFFAENRRSWHFPQFCHGITRLLSANPRPFRQILPFAVTDSWRADLLGVQGDILLYRLKQRPVLQMFG